MSIPRWRRTATSGARLIAGAAIAVAAVAAVAAGVAAPWGSLTHAPVTVDAAPAPASAAASCPGALLAPGRNSLDAAEIGVAAEATSVGQGDRSEIASPAGGAPVVFEGPADAVTGAQSAAIVAEDLIGFAATACTVPRFESWIAAGETTTGSADILIVGNPGDVPATVSLAIWGGDGPVSSPGITDTVVAPRSQLLLPLSGLVVGERSPIVRVSSAGAPVVAALQASLTQTLDPVGIDVVAGAAEPAPTQVVPGVVVPAAVAEGTPPIEVRILSADADTRATVSVVEVGEIEPVATTDVDLTAGSALETAFPGIPAGVYSVRVQAEDGAMLVASATTASAAPRDLAWYLASPELAERALVVAAPGPNPTLVVDAATATEAVTVTLTPADGGESRTASLDAGGSARLDLPASGVWRLETSAPVFAAVTYRGDGALAATPVQAPADEAAVLRVYP